MIQANTFIHQGIISADGFPTPSMNTQSSDLSGGSGGYIYINISTPFGGTVAPEALVSANGGMGVGQGFSGSGG